MAARLTYPVQVEAKLSDDLSRWLWVFKWLLVIPHYIVLAFLWTAFILLSVVVFFAILLTGRYPKAIFDFNVGVLRWSWRVAYYSYGALATDRYPPFTLQEVDDYPVHLSIEYPEKLSRGLVLIKWWLLAIPHYIVVGLLMGGAWVMVRDDGWEPVGFGLIGILTLVAGVALAFTGRYPNGLFDLVLGLNRWVIRVAAYAGLMTDVYPPFRLDLGGHEPGTPPSLDGSPGPATPATEAAASDAPGSDASRGWSAGPILSLIFGSLLALASMGLLAGGATGLWADRTQREGGFVTSPRVGLDSPAYAVVSESAEIHMDGPDWVLPEAIVGDIRVRVAGDQPLFIGIARTNDVDRYLAGVSQSSIPDLIGSGDRHLSSSPGGMPAAMPGDQRFWVASAEGSGTQTIEWPVANGTWSFVVMNADGSRGVDFEGDLGAEAPSLGVIAITMLAIGIVFLVLAGAFVFGAINRAGSTTR